MGGRWKSEKKATANLSQKRINEIKLSLFRRNARATRIGCWHAEAGRRVGRGRGGGRGQGVGGGMVV